MKVLITGAAGLVGQNLIARLAGRDDCELVGIDKHPSNTARLGALHPSLKVIHADLSERGAWEDALDDTDVVVVGHAQIGGLDGEEFRRNNVVATERLLEAIARRGGRRLVHISSSVVNSTAVDWYTETKREQEALVAASGNPQVVLRPTLMFGWFDRKHLGWLRRFMDRTPVFPIPGDGRFVRQPLYVGDFAAIIAACIDHPRTGCYDISGQQQIEYGALIRDIHAVVKPRARLVHIPYTVFWTLLWLYARLDSNPPFTTRQLEALVIPETFPVIDWPGIFNVPATPLRRALEETFLDPAYSNIVLDF
ncbi:NAD-dependent epimerase/dehydratase family protein [Blastochloris viridis]|uniref:Cholesterol dehydrogenase n=1 Tax=Blastochloris viridis TaxID=1079 RepID=A0A0H5BCF5_BLAVI|nr:NAD-dependent epimerase/dehydratase family protein [Blastochloris viridis]ALK10181.1 3 beta-hydroxysteroid dehydrogenase/Delta 5-->4-isomerase [Blastochloris viridis]BAR99887.1 putative transmembrane oxidoreductase protein [Blastochloris viridis]CUU42845.1 Cholesterol dehydrogenase [Blastochloris viridis]